MQSPKPTYWQYVVVGNYDIFILELQLLRLEASQYSWFDWCHVCELMPSNQQVSREVILEDARCCRCWCFAAFAMAKSGPKCPSFRAMARRVLPLLGASSQVFPTLSYRSSYRVNDSNTLFFCCTKLCILLLIIQYILLLSCFAFFWMRRTISIN